MGIPETFHAAAFQSRVPRMTDMRAVRDAIRYMVATGCQRAMLPKDFPPFTTAQYYFCRTRDSGLLDILDQTLVAASRLVSCRPAEPTDGNPPAPATRMADIRDRDGAPGVIAPACESFPTPGTCICRRRMRRRQAAGCPASEGRTGIEIVKRPAGMTGFVAIARRWVVERTFVWPGRCRRLAKDRETSFAAAAAWLLIASIRRSTRYIAGKMAEEA